MPHIRVRGIDRKKLTDVAEVWIGEVAKACGTPPAYFTLELVATEFLYNGNEPVCEVLWFDRGSTVQDLVADICTAHLKKLEPQKDVVVIFTLLPKSGYYENGRHF